MRRLSAALLLLLSGPAAAQAQQPQPDPAGTMLAKVRAFLQKPANKADVISALNAQALSLPGLCPSLTFTPGDILAKDPPPRFDASGEIVEGQVRARFRGEGCGSAHPVFNVWVIRAPGLPARTVAAYPGTSIATVDLEEKATPIAVEAAKRAIPDCTKMGVLNTEGMGNGPAAGIAGQVRETWQVAGCGKLANVGVHFTPNRAAERMEIEAPADEVKLTIP